MRFLPPEPAAKPGSSEEIFKNSTLIFFISITIFGNRVMMLNLWKKEKGGNNELFALFIAVLGMKFNKLSFKKKRELSNFIRSQSNAYQKSEK